MSQVAFEHIKTFPQLVRYLRDELGWPLKDDESFENITFEYDADELGLKDDVAAKVRKIHQLRPLKSSQPWGIFFVDFDPKRLPLTALRKILSKLVIKKRVSANKSDRQAWVLHDLLFISAFGPDSDRRLTLAHFHEAESGDLPTLQVLDWDQFDAKAKLDYTQHKLKTYLKWPEDEKKLDAWRKQWAGAFTLRHRQAITTAIELAQRLAELARGIRDQVLKVLNVETEKGEIRKLYKAFQDTLIHDLKESDFADMYAQTITYGLFSAAVTGDDPRVATTSFADKIPSTNPFLKELLAQFLKVGGRKDKLDYDELGVHEVVATLNDTKTDLPEVMRNWGDKRKEEDPVIHFYEDFLDKYDKPNRQRRGVYYTPQPIVSYIVRSVHELLQTEFGLEDGLASTITWGEMLKKNKDLKLPPLTDLPGEKKTISPDEPFVTILDPATGTATFLVEVIDVIHHTMMEKWTKAKKTPEQRKAAWNEYVPKHLLPRLFGYELMMAPYAIAHMKIGLKLAETSYRFGTNARARIYLTNALEPWVKQLPLIGFDALAHEAAEVNNIKKNTRFTVVIGNPPYSIRSGNLTDEARRLIEPFKFIDGQRIVEKGALQLEKNLNDDYVKFFGLIQKLLANQPVGIVGLITNHAFLDNPTFRGFRWNLLSTFSRLQFLDLHGNSKKKELVPAGSANENVFEIQQGVGVSILLRRPTRSVLGAVTLAEQWGTREEKYWALAAGRFDYRAIECPAPWFKMSVQDAGLAAEFNSYIALGEAMPVNSTGIKTHRDAFVIDFDDQPLRERVARFRSNVILLCLFCPLVKPTRRQALAASPVIESRFFVPL